MTKRAEEYGYGAAASDYWFQALAKAVKLKERDPPSRNRAGLNLDRR